MDMKRRGNKGCSASLECAALGATAKADPWLFPDGYTADHISLRWGQGTAKVLDPKVRLPQFNVSAVHLTSKMNNLTSGPYSQLHVKFRFTRAIGFYMIQIYVPAILIVIISWVSFWLNRDAAPARVSLGVTTVLTMTTLMTTTNSQLPKVSYVKSIDMYLGTCFVMVFASLLEYAWVGYTFKKFKMRKIGVIEMREEKMKNKEPTKMSMPMEYPTHFSSPGYRKPHGYESPVMGSSAAGSLLPAGSCVSLECDCDLSSAEPNLFRLRTPRMNRRMEGLSASQIDKWSRVVFPLIFSGFNDGYTKGDIRLYWLPPQNQSVAVNKAALNMASFDVVDLNVSETTITLSSGNYSRLKTELTFQRQMGFYLTQIYLPSMLVVVISWVSFWVSRESAPARVTLGVTTVLTITTLITTTNRAMPPVSYVKAVDIYLSVCYFMVFAALLEFALVSYSGKRIKDKKTRKEEETLVVARGPTVPPPAAHHHVLPHHPQRRSNNMPPDLVQLETSMDGFFPPCTCGEEGPLMLSSPPPLHRPGPRPERRKNCCGTYEPSRVDRYSRLLFPVLFAIFNAVYWIGFFIKSNKL